MVRVFKGLNDKRKSYYAVTGTDEPYEAMKAVSRYAKQTFDKFWWEFGKIAPYEKGMDGLWWARDIDKGEPCIIVYIQGV